MAYSLIQDSEVLLAFEDNEAGLPQETSDSSPS
jgi:hypothetical protein